MAAAEAAFASLNIPEGSAGPSSPATRDVWLTKGNNHLQYQSAGGLEALAFSSEVTAANAALQGNLNTETAARISGDASTLSSANGYTDAAVVNEEAARALGDAAAVASVASYTDSAVATIN